MSNGAPNKITLTSSDGVDIAVGKLITFWIPDYANMDPLERDVVERSVLIKNMLEDLGESDEAIPIPNVCLHSTSFISETNFSAGQCGCSEQGRRVV